MGNQEVEGLYRSQTAPAKLTKNLYGVPHERGGTSWLDELPDHLKASGSSPDHALLVRYKQSPRSTKAISPIELHSVTIQSPYLKHLIRNEVLGDYPGENIDAEQPTFDAPFHPFFHNWATLNVAYERSKQQDDDKSNQVAALVNVLHENFADSIKDAQNSASNGNITFKLLWTLFPPGCPVLADYNGKKHCCLVNGYKYLMAESPPTLALELLLLDYGGDRYGWRKITMYCVAFAGTARITSLPAVPLHFCENAKSDLAELQSRGSIALDLLTRSPAYESYDGPALLHRPYDDEVEIFVEGRIMVEPAGHAKHASRFSPAVSTKPLKLEYLLTRDTYTNIAGVAQNSRQGQILLSISEILNQHPVLSFGVTKLKTKELADTDDQTILKQHRWTEALFGVQPEAFCRAAVRGYCLTSKSWAEFEVESISGIKWNRNAFDALVIPPIRKRLLEALIRQQQHHKGDFDDVVQGKGQGLIMLLAGPPGTGKTLTAESIADRLQLPLYAVSAGELGDSAKEIEHEFTQVLRLAASWNAVLLLDEADAFLEKRVDTPGARERNKRVAAFLRILEYYKGILILTTNRIVNFDDAFYSRIHLTLPFKPLDQKFREDIWRNFLRDTDIGETDLKSFASEDLNGRQIKNVIKMARLLAKDEGATISASQVRNVLAVMLSDRDEREDGGLVGGES